jgi:hypothetical protein
LATRPTLAATIRVYGTTQRWCRSRRHPHRHPYIVRAPRGRTRGRQWPQKAVAVQLPYPAVGGLFGPLTFAPALACLARPVHADKYIRPVARLERAGRDEQTGRARRERTGWTWNPTGRAGGHQSQRPGGSARARRLSESPRVASSYHAFCLEYRAGVVANRGGERRGGEAKEIARDGRGSPVATPWRVRAGPSALRVTSSGVRVPGERPRGHAVAEVPEIRRATHTK